MATFLAFEDTMNVRPHLYEPCRPTRPFQRKPPGELLCCSLLSATTQLAKKEQQTILSYIYLHDLQLFTLRKTQLAHYRCTQRLLREKHPIISDSKPCNFLHFAECNFYFCPRTNPFVVAWGRFDVPNTCKVLQKTCPPNSRNKCVKADV